MRWYPLATSNSGKLTPRLAFGLLLCFLMMCAIIVFAGFEALRAKKVREWCKASELYYYSRGFLRRSCGQICSAAGVMPS
jgi:hypothetical protein